MVKKQRNGWKLRIAVVECNYKELDRNSKEHFIYGLNSNEMLPEIIHKLTTMKDPRTVTSDQVLAYTT